MGRMMSEYFLPLLASFGFTEFLKHRPDVPGLRRHARSTARRHNWLVGSPTTVAERLHGDLRRGGRLRHAAPLLLRLLGEPAGMAPLARAPRPGGHARGFKERSCRSRPGGSDLADPLGRVANKLQARPRYRIRAGATSRSTVPGCAVLGDELRPLAVTISPISGWTSRTRSPRLQRCGSRTRSATELTALAASPAPQRRTDRFDGAASAPTSVGQRPRGRWRDPRAAAGPGARARPRRLRQDGADDGHEAAVGRLDGDAGRVGGESPPARSRRMPSALRAASRSPVRRSAALEHRGCPPPAPGRPRRAAASAATMPRTLKSAVE